MIGFAIGLLGVWCATAGWVLWSVASGWWNLWSAGGRGVGIVATLLMAPAASLAIAWAMHHRRELRSFRPTGRFALAAVLWGLGVGVMGLVLAAVGVAYSPEQWVDRLIMIGAGAAASLLLVFARARPAWECRGCGYDLRSTLGTVPCPECGRREHVACGT